MRACGTESELTGRCLKLTLTAKTASDELLLTKILDLMQYRSKGSSIVIFREGVVSMEWSVEESEDDV